MNEGEMRQVVQISQEERARRAVDVPGSYPLCCGEYTRLSVFGWHCGRCETYHSFTKAYALGEIDDGKQALRGNDHEGCIGSFCGVAPSVDV